MFEPAVLLVVASLLLAIASVAFGLHKASQHRKMNAYLRSEAWYLYAQSNHALAQFEKAVDLYKRRNAHHIDPELIEHLARSHAFGQDLTRETIRLIQLVEPQFDAETIRQWWSENKFATEKDHALFEMLTTSTERPSRRAPHASSTISHRPSVLNPDDR